MDGTAKRSRNSEWINKIKALKGKKPVEEPKEDEVELTRREMFWWELFVEINAQRMTDKEGIPHPLPLADLKAAADLFSIPVEDYDMFTHVMFALDREYTKVVREEIVARNEREARRKRNKRDRGK